ncbi:MAG: general secretion pathway protein GspK [Planctomycetaceae bacterium]
MRSPQKLPQREGSVLVVVLILVVLLSLSAYKYTQTMITEYTAADMYGRRMQTQAFSSSGVEFAADTIGNRTFEAGENLISDEGIFQGVSIQTGEVAKNNGFVSLVSANESDPNNKSVRFGLTSESGKLNLNYLPALEQQFVETNEDGGDTGMINPQFYDILSGIPGLDDQTRIDSLLDWIDEDDDPRPFGAESSYYQGLNNGYECKNGPIESLEELLQIQGFTAEVLYGEDANRNGLLDKNEDDGSESLPDDDEDGVLNLGILGYCTILSKESNTRADGSDKVNLNQGLMTELYDAIADEFDEERAKFVVAYRLYGSEDAVADEDGSSLTVTQEEVASAVGNALVGDVEGTVSRGGLDLTQPAQFEFTSLFELVDATVMAEVNGTEVALESPWQTGSLQAELPAMFDTFSLTDDAFIENRIDPNYARREVLMTIPEVDPEVADAIAESSVVTADGKVSQSTLELHATPGWIYLEDIVDLPTMRRLEPYLTTRGDIFRVQAVGYYEENGPFSRVEALIDGSEYPAKVVTITDLTTLGLGYSRVQLGLEAEESTR